MRLGEYLLDQGYVHNKDIEEATQYQKINGGPIGKALVSLGRITYRQLVIALYKFNKTDVSDVSLLDALLSNKEITREELNIALANKKNNGGIIGEILVSLDIITYDTLLNYISKELDSENNVKYIASLRFGDVLLDRKLVTVKQLKDVLDFQQQNGGRIGNILVEKKFLSQKQVDAIAKEIREQTRLPLGELLILNREINREQLDKALSFQQISGGKLGDIMLSLEIISRDVLYKYIAKQFEMGSAGENLEIQDLNKIPFEIAKQYNIALIKKLDDHYIIATAEILDNEAISDIKKHLDMEIELVLTSLFAIDKYWTSIYGNDLVEESINELKDDQPENSASVTFTKKQKITMLIITILIILGSIFKPLKVFMGISIFIQLLYFILSLYKTMILMKGINKDAQVRISKEELEAIDERKLPIYTILIPLYKEKEMLKGIVKNINDMDYPKSKLDVRLLLEEDDTETIKAAKIMKLPSCFTTLVVPTSIPKTKPKACNYGLIGARGEYVVIYDAEDRPSLDQLKKVYLTFKKEPEECICVQCKLNYFNSSQNILTNWFTEEYSMWFELLLPGVVQLKIPVPLGGTSNHFKLKKLKQVGAWDPYNVTEDADLGVRLYKTSNTTVVLDSITWEEATSNVGNWIRQRSRWIKGYMQTWLVHMRSPVKLFKEIGFRGFFGFQAMILSSILLPLINPFLWTLMIIWFIFHAVWVPMLFPGIIAYLALILFIVGNFFFTFMHMGGIYWVICEMDKTENNKNIFSYSMVKYALLTPLYWVLHSIAACKALKQLIVNPFHWEKTVHGLTNKKYDSFSHE